MPMFFICFVSSSPTMENLDSHRGMENFITNCRKSQFRRYSYACVYNLCILIFNLHHIITFFLPLCHQLDFQKQVFCYQMYRKFTEVVSGIYYSRTVGISLHIPITFTYKVNYIIIGLLKFWKLIILKEQYD